MIDMDIKLSEEQQQIVLDNQRLVYYAIKKFHIASSEYEDIISIGTIGLIKAVATFDATKKNLFATYAIRCINNEILMYFRKQKHHIHTISLENTIIFNQEGHELTLIDIVPDPTQNFTKQIEDCENLVYFVNLILNYLNSNERIIMLLKIANMKQRSIEKIVHLSQSYISRIVKKATNELKTYDDHQSQFKEVFSMEITNEFYQISFSSNEVKHFNKIFATLLQNIVTTEVTIPNFNVNCTKERIIIQLPAYPESFSFIAQIIQEIDHFNFSLSSKKQTEKNIKEESVIVQEKISSVPANFSKESIEVAPISVSTESKTKLIKDYILSENLLQ